MFASNKCRKKKETNFNNNELDLKQKLFIEDRKDLNIIDRNNKNKLLMALDTSKEVLKIKQKIVFIKYTSHIWWPGNFLFLFYLINTTL